MVRKEKRKVMKAYFVGIKEEELETGADPFVGIFFSDSIVGLGIAIDQRYDPGACEVAEIDINNEGVFFNLKHENDGEDTFIALGYDGATEGLEELFDQLEDNSLEWHDLATWSDDYFDMLDEIMESRNSSEGYLLNAQRIVTLYPLMSDNEKAALEKWEAEHVTGDGRFGTSDWPGWDDVFKRLSH